MKLGKAIVKRATPKKVSVKTGRKRPRISVALRGKKRMSSSFGKKNFLSKSGKARTKY